MTNFKVILLFLVFGTCSLKAQTNTFPANGNVGVGTSTPATWFLGKVLEISDSRPILRFSPLQEGGLATIQFKGAYNTAIGTADEFHINYTSSMTRPRIIVGAYQNGSNPVLSLMGNGNVGIGTEFPNEKLSVNGLIHAREVKVDLNGWPDYVFKKDYKLLSLNDVKSFIEINQHLPDVPSEKKIAENGLALGEMNAILLKKIEELTLYLLEQHKEIQNLKQQVGVLTTKINNPTKQ